jgi:5-methylcytosine-specific restriction protein A
LSPVAPRKPCRAPGCKELVTGSYCGKHECKKEAEVKVQRIKYDKERGTSASRGYSYRWTKYSLQYRKNHPLCVMCEAKGKLTLAECVDHIEAVEDKDDPKFWDASNHQSLCNTCHNIKSEAEGNRYNNKERFV